MQDRAMFSRASLLLAAFALLLTAPLASASSTPSDQAAASLHALFSDENGVTQELIPGWQFVACEAGPERGSCDFAHPYDGTIRLFFAAADSGHKAYAETPSFKIWFSQQGDYPKDPQRLQELDSFLAAAVAAVTAGDTGSALFETGSLGGTEQTGEVLQRPREQPEDPSGRLLFLMGFLLLPFAALSLGGAGAAGVRSLRQLPRRELTAVLLIVAGGIAARLLAPHNLVKVGMFYPLMDSAISLDSLPRYGPCGPAVYNLLFRVFPVSTDTVLWFHSVIGGFNVLLAVALFRRWLAPSGAALLTCFLAFTPLFVRDSNSESLLVIGMFFLLSGLLAVADFARSGRRLTLIAGFCLLAPTLYLRPEFLVITPLSLAALIVPDAKPGRSKALAVVMAGLVVAAIPYILFLREVLSSELAQGNLTGAVSNPFHLFGDQVLLNILFRPGSYPVTLAILALAGPVLAIYAGKQHYRRIVPLFLLGLVWVAVTDVDLNEESLLRLQVPAAMLFSVSAAYAVGEFTRLSLQKTRAGVVPAAALVVFVAAAAPTMPGVFFETNSHAEDRFFRQATALLPDEPVVFVRIGREDMPEYAVADAGRSDEEPVAGAAPVHRQYPDYLLQPPHRDDRAVSVTRWRSSGALQQERTFFYLGTRCYAVKDAGGDREWGLQPDPDRLLHPACRWVLTGYDLAPVVTARVKNLGEYEPAFRWYPESTAEMTLGLFEVTRALDSRHRLDSFANLADHYHAAARAHIGQGDFQTAELLLLEGYELLPGSPVMWEHLASYYFLAGTRKDSRELLEKAVGFYELLADHPVEHPALLSLFGSVFFMYADHLTDSEIDAYIEGRLSKDADDPIGTYLKGLWLFYDKWDYAGSIPWFEKVLELRPDEPRAYLYLALNNFYQGNQRKAEILAERSIELSGGRDADCYYVRSIIIREKDLAGAVKDIEKYLKLTEGEDKVRFDKKEAWLRKELEALK